MTLPRCLRRGYCARMEYARQARMALRDRDREIRDGRPDCARYHVFCAKVLIELGRRY